MLVVKHIDTDGSEYIFEATKTELGKNADGAKKLFAYGVSGICGLASFDTGTVSVINSHGSTIEQYQF